MEKRTIKIAILYVIKFVYADTLMVIISVLFSLLLAYTLDSEFFLCVWFF